MVVRATELSSAIRIRAGNLCSGAQTCERGGGWEAPQRAGYALQRDLSVQYGRDCSPLECNQNTTHSKAAIGRSSSTRTAPPLSCDQRPFLPDWRYFTRVVRILPLRA